MSALSPAHILPPSPTVYPHTPHPSDHSQWRTVSDPPVIQPHYRFLPYMAPRDRGLFRFPPYT